jgi:hypothetical protein
MNPKNAEEALLESNIINEATNAKAYWYKSGVIFFVMAALLATTVIAVSILLYM